jgi:hypothetical protein
VRPSGRLGFKVRVQQAYVCFGITTELRDSTTISRHRTGDALRSRAMDQEVWADREKKITQLPHTHTTRVKSQTAECITYQTRQRHILLIHVATAARQNQRYDR